MLLCTVLIRVCDCSVLLIFVREKRSSERPCTVCDLHPPQPLHIFMVSEAACFDQKVGVTKDRRYGGTERGFPPRLSSSRGRTARGLCPEPSGQDLKNQEQHHQFFTILFFSAPALVVGRRPTQKRDQPKNLKHSADWGHHPSCKRAEVQTQRVWTKVTESPDRRKCSFAQSFSDLASGITERAIRTNTTSFLHGSRISFLTGFPPKVKQKINQPRVNPSRGSKTFQICTLFFERKISVKTTAQQSPAGHICRPYCSPPSPRLLPTERLGRSCCLRAIRGKKSFVIPSTLFIFFFFGAYYSSSAASRPK